MTNEMRIQAVSRLAKQKALWVIGGHENAIEDGILDSMPSIEVLVKEVYDEIVKDPRVQVGGGVIELKKDIRFLGKEKLTHIAKVAVALALV